MKTKIKSGYNWKIKNTDEFLPHIMYGIIDENGLMEITDYNRTESYMLLFKTEAEAQEHINKMNEDFCVWPNGYKSYWYKNRNNKPIEINTKLIRFKSKFYSLQQALNNLYK